MQYNKFHYALFLLETLYDITLPEDQFEEIALVGWELIGNNRVKLYRYSICLDGCQTQLTLPCNVFELEAVTTRNESYGTDSLGEKDLNSISIENSIERSKYNMNPHYIPGQYIKYELVGNTLYFDKPYRQINILYKGLVLDEDGLPEITNKEATALATFCAYTVKFKEGIKTNNPNIISLADRLQMKWFTQCDQARVDGHMSQNNWDDILDARVSWNRKQYRKSLKVHQ